MNDPGAHPTRGPEPALSSSAPRRHSWPGEALGLCLAVALALPLEASSLADALEQRELAAARTLASPATVNTPQVDGMTALHWAAYHEDLESVRWLLGLGADPNGRNRYGVTPLSLACVNGNRGIVDALLAAGADPAAELPGGETPLMTAARTGRPGPVAALLARGVEVEAREQKGQTALMWAAAEGHVEVVEQLLRAGASFRTALESGFTAWFFAIREGRMEVVRAMLAAGADAREVMAPTRTGGKLPRKGTAGLHLAVENGHFELALALVAAGADPDDQRPGHTPLHMLSWVRKPDRGDDGDPAPVGSGAVDSLQFARALVAAGANVNARLERGSTGPARLGRKGATPFLLAADTADLPLMRLLMELGADPLLPNADGSTPLMAAAGLGTLAPMEEAGTEAEALEAVKYLLTLGADVNTLNVYDESAMHGAAYASFPMVVQALHEAGARFEVWYRKNTRGWTPWLIAEGHRPGNFKPSFETLEAIKALLVARGEPLPAPTPAPVAMGYESL